MKNDLLRKIVIGTFLSVPAVSSIISTIHLIDLFNLGNPTWLSILLAVTFELGSIASLLAISVIERIKTGAIWFIFSILAGLQILGNVYYSYSFTSDQMLANQTFLTNFMDLFSFITGDEIRDVKIFLACIIGVPIPLIALFFLKSNIDYLRPKGDGAIVEKEDATTNDEPSSDEKKDDVEVAVEDVVPEELEDASRNDEGIETLQPESNDHVTASEETNVPVQTNNFIETVSTKNIAPDEHMSSIGRSRTRHPMISSRRFS